MSSGRLRLLDLLAAWRQAVGLDLGAATDLLKAGGVISGKSTLSQWESGSRSRLDRRRLDGLDACYGAQGALIDMAAALATPDGMQPSTTWAHNTSPGGGPSWAWIRPTPGHTSIDALLLWGAFAYSCAAPCDDNGVLVTSTVSMPNPAVWVHLQSPGWVDFGRGRVPPELGLPVFDVLAGATVGTSAHSAVGLVASRHVQRFQADPMFAEAVLRFFDARPDLIRDVFTTTLVSGGPARLADSQPLDLAAGPLAASEAFRRLREARGLSLIDAAAAITAMLPTEPMSDDQLRGFEHSAEPRRRFVRSRLDRLYRADGALAQEEVDVVRVGDRVRCRIPPFWVGPIWFWFEAGRRAAPSAARLWWDEHYREVNLADRRAATCRRPFEVPDVPFEVECARTWTVRAGVGRLEGARDINQGWHRRGEPDRPAEREPDADPTFLAWFGRTPEDFRAFLDDFDA